MKAIKDKEAETSLDKSLVKVLPGGGIETVRQVVKVAPDIPIVVLAGLDDEQTGLSAIGDGGMKEVLNEYQ